MSVVYLIELVCYTLDHLKESTLVKSFHWVGFVDEPGLQELLDTHSESGTVTPFDTSPLPELTQQ
jgi:hypothetical protein